MTRPYWPCPPDCFLCKWSILHKKYNVSLLADLCKTHATAWYIVQAKHEHYINTYHLLRRKGYINTYHLLRHKGYINTYSHRVSNVSLNATLGLPNTHLALYSRSSRCKYMYMSSGECDINQLCFWVWYNHTVQASFFNAIQLQGCNSNKKYLPEHKFPDGARPCQIQ